MKNVMLRTAKNDFDAMRIANAMLACGADVFSITYDGEHIAWNARSPTSKFIVWAKTRDDAHTEEIDEAITREFEKCE